MILVPNFGPGDISAEVAAAAADVPNLELLPVRPPAELGELLDGAVAVINTSQFEGMPNVSLEGWARGIPTLALAYDPDGVIERHGLGGYANGSPERLAELAREYWERREESSASERAGRCRRYVERHHAPGAIVDAWLRVLGLVPAPDNASLVSVEAI